MNTKTKNQKPTPAPISPETPQEGVESADKALETIETIETVAIANNMPSDLPPDIRDFFTANPPTLQKKPRLFIVRDKIYYCRFRVSGVDFRYLSLPLADLPQNALDFLLEYGLKQKLNDSCAADKLGIDIYNSVAKMISALRDGILSLQEDSFIDVWAFILKNYPNAIPVGFVLTDNLKESIKKKPLYKLAAARLRQEKLEAELAASEDSFI